MSVVIPFSPSEQKPLKVDAIQFFGEENEYAHNQVLRKQRVMTSVAFVCVTGLHGVKLLLSFSPIYGVTSAWEFTNRTHDPQEHLIMVRTQKTSTGTTVWSIYDIVKEERELMSLSHTEDDVYLAYNTLMCSKDGVPLRPHVFWAKFNGERQKSPGTDYDGCKLFRRAIYPKPKSDSEFIVDKGPVDPVVKKPKKVKVVNAKACEQAAPKEDISKAHELVELQSRLWPMTTGDVSKDAFKLKTERECLETKTKACEDRARIAEDKLKTMEDKYKAMEDELKTLKAAQPTVNGVVEGVPFCMICMEEPVTMALLPCAHARFCKKCCLIFAKCPECDAVVTHRARVYI